MSTFVPYHLVTFPVLSRSGSARFRNDICLRSIEIVLQSRRRRRFAQRFAIVLACSRHRQDGSASPIRSPARLFPRNVESAQPALIEEIGPPVGESRYGTVTGWAAIGLKSDSPT